MKEVKTLKRGICIFFALVCSRIIGYNLFVSVLFGIVGLYFAQILFRTGIKISPYAFFVLILVFGLAGEIITALSKECENQENFYAAWLIFVPTLCFLFRDKGLRGATRKIMGTGYAVLLMLLHFYAKAEMGEMASLSFLPLQLSLLFFTVYSLKQKNGAS